MNFVPGHYVPVLKVKRGEKQALASISPTLSPRITPLLEIVERKADKAPSLGDHIKTAFKDLAESVRPYSRCFLDAREIAPDGTAAASLVFRRATALGIVFTPVTGISRTADTGAALRHRAHGLALRLTRAELEAGDLALKLRRWMERHQVVPEATDLIMDLGAVDDLVTEGVSAMTDAFLAEVPDHGRWQTLTVSGCAFPLSMGVVERHSHALVERADWLAWRVNLHGRRQSLQRLPVFSDCAIQHVKGVEGFDPRIMPVSASVRYSTSDHWLLIKGQSARLVPPGAQFPALATQLVYGHLRSYYAGAGHCEGCRRIKAAADGASGLGSPEVWRRLGTIHHITTAVEGLASLTWP